MSTTSHNPSHAVEPAHRDPSLDERLAGFIRAAYANAPGVRRWFAQANLTADDVQSVADLEKVPVLTKDQMIALQAQDPPFGGFLAAPIEEVHRIFQSPGPLYEPQGAEEGWVRTGVSVLRSVGFGPGDVVLNALSYHFSPGGFLLDSVLRSAGCTVAPVGVGAAELQVKMLVDLGASGFAGLPSWLMTLLRKADELGVPRGQIHLRRALFSAEPLTPTDRAYLVEHYGLQIVNAYATAELGFLAYDTEGSPMMRLVEEPIVQLVDRHTGRHVQPGEVGEVVVTNLNPTYPLIRFGTGDLALYHDPAPGVSRQQERAIRLIGRVGDAVKVRGMFVHPNQLRAALTPFGVAAFAAFVRRPATRDEFVLRLVADDEAKSQQERLLATVREFCRVSVDVVEWVDELGEQAGKIVDERAWDV